MYATTRGGHKPVSGDRCILDLFLKNTRGGSTATPIYDFLMVIELQLHFSSAFCVAVDTHRLIEEGKLQVCGSYIWWSNFLRSTQSDSISMEGLNADMVRTYWVLVTWEA